MVTTSTFAHAPRLHSYELLARRGPRAGTPVPGEHGESHQPLSRVDPVEVFDRSAIPAVPLSPGIAPNVCGNGGWFTGSGDTDCTLSAEQMSAGSRPRCR